MNSKSYIFDVDHAKLYGVDEAIMLRNFIFWIEKNKATGINFRDGRSWTYNTYESFTEIFPFWSESQIRRILDKLVSLGILLKTSQYNRRNNDKTNWYAFKNEDEFLSVKSPKEMQNNGLSESSEQPDLFSPAENELMKSSDQGKKVDNNEVTLPESSDQKDLSSNPTDESVSPADEIDTSICRNQQIDLTESSEHYHIINNILNKITKTDINVSAFLENGQFFFQFNDPEELDKHITQMFKQYVNAMPHFTFIDRVKKEMLDLNHELTNWTTWNIIVRCFTLYPGWEKQFRTIDSLIGKIRKTKAKYIEEHYKAFVKRDELKEARQDRNNARTAPTHWNQDATKKQVEEHLAKYADKLSERDRNKIQQMIDSGDCLLAQGLLINILEEKGIAA